MNDAELAAAVAALQPVVTKLMSDPEDPTWNAEDPDFQEGVLSTATLIVRDLEQSGWRLRPALPLPPGTMRAELVTLNQLAVLGTEGKIRLEGPPSGGPGAFVMTPEGVWLAVQLQPHRVYELRPDPALWTPAAPGARPPS